MENALQRKISIWRTKGKTVKIIKSNLIVLIFSGLSVPSTLLQQWCWCASNWLPTVTGPCHCAKLTGITLNDAEAISHVWTKILMCHPEFIQLMFWTRRNNKAQQKSTTIVVFKALYWILLVKSQNKSKLNLILRLTMNMV